MRKISLRYWTAAVTHWREERRAAHHIEKLGLQYYLPETKDYEQRRVLLLPGVILIKLRGAEWAPICYAKGINYLLMMPIDEETALPARVRPEEMRRLKAMASDDSVQRYHPRFRNGMSVVVESAAGVYSGVQAKVQGNPVKGRVQVTWQMMGRTVRKEFAERMLRAA